MDYNAALAYLFEHLPMYQRIGHAAYKKDLTNIRLLCRHLGNPQEQIKTIHIAGTNGKGSVSHALAAVFTQAGYNTGLYISPHYQDFRERIKINGNYIDKNSVAEFVTQNRAVFDEIQPSFFEMTVAMAFWYFARCKTDMAIIETGLGGRLDSTNIITPLLSVITNISFDHMNVLGNTLPQIAAEKAGIIKPNVPVVIGETHPETELVFRVKAAETNSDIHFAQQSILLCNEKVFNTHITADVLKNGEQIYTHLQTDLSGSFQLKNMVTIIQATELLPALGYPIHRETVAQALSGVKQLTNFIGRWQVISEKNPLIIADSAHNEGGLRYAISQLLSLPHHQLHIVMGVVNDKDLQHILPLFPTKAVYYFCKADVPRGMPAEDLQQQALKFGLTGNAYPSVPDAYTAAKAAAQPGDVVFVGGSIFVVAEIL